VRISLSVARPASQEDPSLARRSPTGWRRWLAEVGQHRQDRVAVSGAILLAGCVAAVGTLYGFAFLAYAVLEQQTQALDLSALKALQQFSSPGLTEAAMFISLFGSQAVILVCLALLTLFIAKSRWGAAVTLVLVAGGAQVLNDVLKELFHRTRPTPIAGFIDAQQFSFPSGHAMISAAFYMYLAYLTWNLVRGNWRILLAAALVALVLLIGLARLYLEAHYLSDVIAGYLAGLLWTDSVILGARVLSDRRRRRAVTRAPAT
jgi:membrane-associated phospholipid phosphatase